MRKEASDESGYALRVLLHEVVSALSLFLNKEVES